MSNCGLETCFDAYFESNYRLLGCVTDNKVYQSILSNYCERDKCSKLNIGEKIVVNGTEIQLKAGMKISDVVEEINKNSSKTGVTALATGADGTGSGSYLTLRNNRFGSKYDLKIKSLTSNEGAGTTGIGTKEMSGDDHVGQLGGGSGMVGLDVQGTINGEAATGDGQMLTGSSDDKDAKAKGLALMITSEGPMSTKLRFSKGFGAVMRDKVVGMTGKTGIFTQTQESLNDEIDTTNQSIADMETRLLAQQDRLYAQFSSMESQLAKLQNQGSYLTSMLSGSSKK
jgi:flagellar hook-associated protein 2